MKNWFMGAALSMLLSSTANAGLVYFDIFADLTDTDAGWNSSIVDQNQLVCGNYTGSLDGYIGCFGADFDAETPASFEAGDSSYNIQDMTSFFLSLFLNDNYLYFSAGEQGIITLDSNFNLISFSFSAFTQSQGDRLNITYDDVSELRLETVNEEQGAGGNVTITQRVDAVPEPQSLFILALGLLSVFGLRRKA